MTTRSLVWIVCVLLIISLIAELSALYEIHFTGNLIYFSGIARIGAIFLLAREGTSFKRKYFRPIFFMLLALVWTGALFKIMHWEWANIMLFGGLLGMAVTYCFAFATKPIKSALDILKLVWVILFCIAAIFKIGHYPYGEIVLAIEPLLFLILFFTFAFRVLQVKE